MKLSGSQTLVKLLKAHGVEYVAGIPGHGSWAIVDALHSTTHGIPFIQVIQEQSAVHLADGYFRACGRPMAALVPTAIDVSKAVTGLACAHAEASAVLLLSGGEVAHIPVQGPIEEKAPLGSEVSSLQVKAQWLAQSPAELPDIMRSAFACMLDATPGPVSLTLPLEVQYQSVEWTQAPGSMRAICERYTASRSQIKQASTFLAKAARPVIVAGGGVLSADACSELLLVAEGFSTPVINGPDGKGCIPEDHRLAAGATGRWGSACANALLANADLVFLVGCRPLALSPCVSVIQIDDDLEMQGRSAQLLLGIEADIRSVLADLGEALSTEKAARLSLQRTSYLTRLDALREAWEARLTAPRTDESAPFLIQRPLAELRAALEHDAVIVVGAGSVRRAVQQMFPVYVPRSHLSSSTFGALGWAVPAAIGAKLALPARQVVCVVGDGDFLQAMQEMAVCVMHCIPVLFMVFNNSGYVSLRDGQTQRFGRHYASEFNLPDGKPYSPDFTEIARSFGLESWRVEHTSQLAPALHKALNSKGPALLEVLVSRQSTGVIDPFADELP
ncbi:thiamine pyrophosphate-binding protein [Pseudomonas helleri]|uniref:Thiamine pyrophosphate-binding protein n=1 Tax=Pseudomonas helleri TaxID=1608996 RepID=A0A6I1WJ63_9PSED|nr:thiamine pyrophosphate-binding protein [Pseudomonas helleri]MQU41968.1 thiamine pyrophosphate-binding protein [Pseudomonas helleri]